jgi:GAF domain-containing protein
MEKGRAGVAYRTMKPTTLRGPFTEETSYPVLQVAMREGLQSFCFLPLVRRSRAIAVLALGRLTNEAFSDTDISFLTQVSNQVALAVENALPTAKFRN